MPPHYTIDYKRFALGRWLTTAGILFSVPIWFSNYILREDMGTGPLLLTAIPALGLLISAAIVLYRARTCPKCERHLKADAIPRHKEERGGTFYCPHCGAEIRIQ